MKLFAWMACASLALGACGGARATPNDPPAEHCVRGRTFVVVRHAEKASSDKDPPLSERGRARATVLATMLGPAGVTRLVATQYRRTQETLAPLAERTALPVEVRDASATAALVDELRAAPDGAVVVIATHSNVLPFVVKQLSGKQLRGVSGDALADDDYGRVAVVVDACGARAPSLLELGGD